MIKMIDLRELVDGLNRLLDRDDEIERDELYAVMQDAGVPRSGKLEDEDLLDEQDYA